MLSTIARCFLAVSLLLTASSCLLFQGKYTVHGLIISAGSNQPVADVKVTLIKLVGNFSIIPSLIPSESIVTSASGTFTFPVEARRAVYVRVEAPGENGKMSISVPLEKIQGGQIRLEIKLEKDGHPRFRWNDEDWVPERYGIPLRS